MECSAVTVRGHHQETSELTLNAPADLGMCVAHARTWRK